MIENKRNVILRIKYWAETLCSTFPLLIFLLSFLLLLSFSSEIKASFFSTFSLLLESIIPSVFPFMIISDYLISEINFQKLKLKNKSFPAVFGGILCGFPIGASLSVRLYKDKKITKEECERLIAISNNASPSFVLGAIGVGFYNSLNIGLIIYLSLLLSIFTLAFLTKSKSIETTANEMRANTKFSFSRSVKSATEGTLNVIGFILAFSVIMAVLKCVLKSELTYSLISPFLEITNATKTIADSNLFSTKLKVAFTAFAVGFSGLSVHMQTKAIIMETDVSLKKYYLRRFFVGLMSFFISFMFLSLTE